MYKGKLTNSCFPWRFESECMNWMIVNISSVLGTLNFYHSALNMVKNRVFLRDLRYVAIQILLISVLGSCFWWFLGACLYLLLVFFR